MGCLTAFFMQRAAHAALDAGVSSIWLSDSAGAGAAAAAAAATAAAALQPCFWSPSELEEEGRKAEAQLLWQLAALLRLRVLGQLRTGPCWPCCCLVGLSITGESGPMLPLLEGSKLTLVMALLPQRLMLPAVALEGS
jgi:hypothetical protein